MRRCEDVVVRRGKETVVARPVKPLELTFKHLGVWRGNLPSCKGLVWSGLSCQARLGHRVEIGTCGIMLAIGKAPVWQWGQQLHNGQNGDENDQSYKQGYTIEGYIFVAVL